MNVEFRKSFVKDLKNISDKSILKRIGVEIESVENAVSLQELANRKKKRI